MNKFYSDEQMLLTITLILCGFGIIVIYSASSLYAMSNFGNHMFFLLQQLKWISIGIILMLMTSKIIYHLIHLIFLLISKNLSNALSTSSYKLLKKCEWTWYFVLPCISLWKSFNLHIERPLYSTYRPFWILSLTTCL